MKGQHTAVLLVEVHIEEITERCIGLDNFKGLTSGDGIVQHMLHGPFLLNITWYVVMHPSVNFTPDIAMVTMCWFAGLWLSSLDDRF